MCMVWQTVQGVPHPWQEIAGIGSSDPHDPEKEQIYPQYVFLGLLEKTRVPEGKNSMWPSYLGRY